jgi:hypothetical protein
MGSKQEYLTSDATVMELKQHNKQNLLQSFIHISIKKTVGPAVVAR